MLILVGAPVLNKDVTEEAQTTTQETSFTTGTLPSGKKFYKYQYLLYADDFNPHSTLFPRIRSEVCT